MDHQYPPESKTAIVEEYCCLGRVWVVYKVCLFDSEEMGFLQFIYLN